jgi:hypothetical protein
VGNAATVAKYCLYLLDARWEGRWANKSLVLFAIEFSADLMNLALYIAFFMVVTAYVFLLFRFDSLNFLSYCCSPFSC